ncbi:MAG TPA: hypothetical protein VND19_13670 [Acetobacteraceae bacterium]|nr:hypothetical protein [Acetobacteraceae bacterium]
MLDSRKQAGEEATIPRIVDDMRWPEDMKGYDVEFGSDWEGDPAVRVWFLIDDDLRPSDEKLQRVGRFKDAVTRALLDAELSHWPFVRLRAPHPSQA